MQQPVIIDSHAHLDYPQLAADLPGVLARAETAGVRQIISIGVKLSTSNAPREIAEAHDNVWFSIGVHPHEAANEPLSCDRDAFLAAANHPKCVAIGEAGLDYFYDYAPREKQAESFRVQIGVARQLGLPIIVHARDADEDVGEGEGGTAFALPQQVFLQPYPRTELHKLSMCFTTRQTSLEFISNTSRHSRDG